MQLELTDHLICPRCSPEQPLVLLIHEAREGRVWRGWLGCPRCRADYPIDAGLADLREARDVAAVAEEPFEPAELPLKMAALVGVTEGPAFVYAAPPLAGSAPAAAPLVAGVEWVTAGALAAAQEERAGVSRLLFDGPQLPLASARLRGAALARAGVEDVREAARVLWPGARLVLFGAQDGVADAVGPAGLETLAREDATWVLRRTFA